MGSAQLKQLVDIEDYLSGELISEIKHEYLGGVVYAMAGGTNRHSRIASNVLGLLHAQLLGKPCQPFNSDTKIRIRLMTQTRFYYPDVSVVCRQNPLDQSFQDDPAVVVEVLSEATRRIDEGEKREAYLTIPSLAVYILLDQDSPAAVVYRRTATGFVTENFAGADAVIALPEIQATLPLSEAYAGSFEA